MLINDRTIIELKPESLVLHNAAGEAGTKEEKLGYVECPPVRDAVRRIVRIAAEEYREELFPNICGRCGSCCMGREVAVTAKEIQKISYFLNIYDEDEFREKYVEPSHSWNERDGIIKSNNRCCIFLEKRSSGCYSCSVYQVRPKSCISTKPTISICNKDLLKLRIHLEKVWIEGEDIEISVQFFKKLKVKIGSVSLREAVDDLREIIARVEDRASDPREEMIAESNKKLDFLRKIYFEEGMSADFAANLQELSELIGQIARAASQGSETVPLLCAKLARLMGYVDEDVAAVERGERYPQENLERVSLHNESLFADMREMGVGSQFILQYRDHPALLRKVTGLVDLLLSSEEPIIQESLWHIEPFCFMCGECCRCFKVEITLHDIERIADHLLLSEREVWERFLEPGIYTWNEGIGIIRKAPVPQWGATLDSSKVESPLQSEAQGKSGLNDAMGCIFLGQKEDGLAQCTIYEARPKVCRDYPAYGRPCQKMSLKTKRDTHAHNIISIYIEKGVMSLTTRQTVACSLSPVLIYLRENKRISEAFQSIKEEITTVISVMREEETAARLSQGRQ